MRVLVTGGRGFIGSYTVEELLARGHAVTVLTRTLDHPWPLEGVAHVLGDVRDATAVTEAVSHCDAFVHLAGVLGTQETIDNPFPAAETNIYGGLNVLQAAAQARVPGVCIAVGNYWMNNTYAITKSVIERFADMYNQYRGSRVSVVRALNAYGPRQVPAQPYGPSRVRKIIPAFVCRALGGAPIEVYGDGEQVMDMVHVSDVAKVLVSVLEHTVETGIVYAEAGTGRTTTVNEIVACVLESARPYVVSSEVLHVPMRSGEPSNSVVVGDPSTLDILGSRRPQLTALEDGMPGTVEYYAKEWPGPWRV